MHVSHKHNNNNHNTNKITPLHLSSISTVRKVCSLLFVILIVFYFFVTFFAVSILQQHEQQQHQKQSERLPLRKEMHQNGRKITSPPPAPQQQQQQQQDQFGEPQKQQQNEADNINKDHSLKQEFVVERSNKDNSDVRPLYSSAVDSAADKNNNNKNPFFSFDRSRAEHFFKQQGGGGGVQDNYRKRIITAYLEVSPLNDSIPGTGSRGDLKNEDDLGSPPEYYVPLPLRTQSPHDLRKVEYTNHVQTCHDMPGKFPIDRGLQFDDRHHPIVWNVGDKPGMSDHDFVEQELPYCPVEADPFLPWIHDMFPSVEGTRIEFVAHNKRKCRTGKHFSDNVKRLTPQATLFQPISVQRISESEARQLAPSLWSLEDEEPDEKKNTTTSVRYRLAPFNESDVLFTRFICRFHGYDFQSAAFADSNEKNGSSSSNRSLPTVLLAETLSGYTFNYEFVAYRKLFRRIWTPKGKDTMIFWSTTLLFHCPVPASLQSYVESGQTILSDGTPTLFLDLVPIRTSPRYYTTSSPITPNDKHDGIYLTEDQIGPKDTWELPAFDPVTRWGPANVLPRVEASGRWANLPICWPPRAAETASGSRTTTGLAVVPRELESIDGQQQQQPNYNDYSAKKKNDSNKQQKKQHYLSACLWASAEFKTRGKSSKSDTQTDTVARLMEWLEFHRMVGFDHVYLYDNSGAHTDQSPTPLEALVDQYYSDFVTRIDWPAVVCNNNVPAHDSCGERSSQYAAENSCRARYAPFSEWMVSFDTDEYFVPMGDYDSLKDVLKHADKGGSKILSFPSSRTLLRPSHSSSLIQKTTFLGMEKLHNVTFLEAYNCDSGGLQKKPQYMRAKKQIFKADYVVYRFVHWSTVTKGLLHTYRQSPYESGNGSGYGHGGGGAIGVPWKARWGDQRPTERKIQDATEATMVHTKFISRGDTENFREVCHKDNTKKWKNCWVAFPWPNGKVEKGSHAHDKDGMLYNCFVNKKLENHWIPKLHKILLPKLNASTRN